MTTRVAGRRLAVTIDVERPRPRLELHFVHPDAPTVTCDLAGTVASDSIRAEGLELRFRLRPFPEATLLGHGVLDLDVRLSVDPEEGSLTLEVDGPPNYPIDRLAVPGDFRLGGPHSAPWRFLLPLGEGISLPAERSALAAAPRALPEEIDLFGSWITLPVIGVTVGPDARGGAFLVSSPQAHDHTVGLLPADDDGGPGLRLVQQATLGRFGYRRAWRLQWVAEPGLVAVARAVRRELHAAGIAIETLADKLARRGMSEGSIESVGGTHLWWHVDPFPAWLPSELRREGLRSVVLMGPGDGASVAAARDADLVAGTYVMTSDIYPPGEVQVGEWRNLFPPEGSSDGWPDQLALSREGWTLPNWFHTPAPEAVDLWEDEEYLGADGQVAWRSRTARPFTPTQGYYRCPHFHEPTTQRSVLPRLDELRTTAVMCDVTTANGLIECFAPDHPCDRGTDVALRQAQLRSLGADGRFVISECGMWWALDVADAFEGSLKYEGHLNNRVLGDYPFRPEWLAQFDLEHRIPLLGLVARPAVVRTMWWGHGHDRHPETWDAKDALCALFGANPIFVADPAHPLEPGTAKWDRFVTTVRAFDVLRERTFGAAIRSYEVVDRHTGVTEFDDGTQVRATLGVPQEDGTVSGSFEIRSGDGELVWPQT